MADLGYVKSAINGLRDAGDRKIWTQVFTHVLQSISFGEPEHQMKSANFNAYFQTSTTPAVANTEFSIAHGLATAPRVAIPVMDLSQPGSAFVPLTVTRSADSKRVYFRSTSTSAVVTVLVAP